MSNSLAGADLPSIHVIDSHTGGEPTRVVVDGFPQLRGETLSDRAVDLAARYRRLATELVDEPRGNEAMVAALLIEPADERCAAGVIFFDRALVLGMCGHGMIGLVETLRWLGRLGPGEHLVETPVGVIPVTLADDRRVSLDNVASRRVEQAVSIDVPSVGHVVGDIAYGGNTFFLVAEPSIDLDRPKSELLGIAADVMRSLHAAGHDEVDHVELFGPPTTSAANSRNFVLCPSGTYDRSPCGTGTSAKVAALAADGLLAEGETWVQESITGSQFSVRYRWHDVATGAVVPTITGSAMVTGEARLFFEPELLGVSDSEAERRLRVGAGDAVDLEVVGRLEVAHRGLGARPVRAVDGDRIAQRDEGDLYLLDLRTRGPRQDVLALRQVVGAQLGELGSGLHRHPSDREVVHAVVREGAVVHPALVGDVEHVDTACSRHQRTLRDRSPTHRGMP